ncbi:VOC family protein [Candidatus Neomarinimicrobiota bacterium]
MKFKFSRCVAIQAKEKESALIFYRDVMGFETIDVNENITELKSDGPGQLFLDESNLDVPVLEFIVDNIEAAREHLLKNGCEVIRWNGVGKDCFMRDPFDVIFNLWQE